MINKLLDNASRAYYKGNPFMSDAEFDTLAEKYNYVVVGAPTTGKRVEHFIPMLSLNKIYVGEGDNPLAEYNTVTTPKLDGAAISLLYKEGFLVQAATRGDGVVGLDITDKFLSTDIVPIKIATPETLQVTGEIVAPKTIKNARNYASGALNLKDIEEFKNRDIHFVAYGLSLDTSEYIDGNYQWDMASLSTFGFKTVMLGGLEDIYPTDGVVCRVISNIEFWELGKTAKHPKGAIAIKNRDDVAIEETDLLDVIWQVGKGGKVTPVAVFEEVTIEDANINKATLHNAGFVKELDLYIGDTILITRAGGITPKVVGKL